MPADRLGQLAALFISDVARRRADQSRDGILFHILGHIDSDHVLLIVEQRLCESLCKLRLADAGGSEEQERADRPRRVLDARLRAHNCLADLGHSLILSDHSLVKLRIEMQRLVALGLRQLRHRNASPAGHDRRNLILRHFLVHQRGVLVLRLGLLRFHLIFQLRQLAVLQLCRLVVIPLLLRELDLVLRIVNLLLQFADSVYVRLFVLPLRFLLGKLILQIGELLLQILQALLRQRVVLFLQRRHLDLHLHNLPVHLIEILRERIHLRLDHGAGFIHQVNRLVRQKPVRDITVRQRRSGNQGRILNFDAVIDLEAVLQTAQDGDGILHRGFIDHDRLEPAGKRLVLLNVLPVLVQRRRADAVQLAARQHRLEHIARVK